jgi:hypothetical protein
MLGASVSPASSWREQVEADWLRQDARRLGSALGGPPTPQEDAAGGVDGVKEGKWGFHTEFEDSPWWQVDLQRVVNLEQIVVYNRCDSCVERIAHLNVLVAGEDRLFRQVYRHDGKTFYGAVGGAPLTVRLAGVQARHVRLAIPGRSYFHLDEVEVYPAGEQGNIARGKPATQSSVSQWSV